MSVKEAKKKSAKQVEKEALDAYLAEASSWETSKVMEERASKKRAYWVAGVASALAVISTTGLSVMGPLKTVEPAIVSVDKSTGIVDVVKTLVDGKTNYDEVINKFFVQKYVKYRENYSRALAKEHYTNVGLMSSSREQQRYFAYMSPKNPDSPLNVYGDTATVKIKIKSTSFINPNVALVRYIKEIERGQQIAVTHWAATVTFSYINPPTGEIEREVNPLGFSAEEYRNDPEGVEFEKPQKGHVAPVEKKAEAGVTLYPSNDEGATR